MTRSEDHEARRTSLQQVLMEANDPGERAAAHLELGRIALRDGQLEGAVRHLKEALVLDRRLHAARALLAELGEASTLQVSGGGRRGVARALLGRIRGRATGGS